MSSKVGLQFEEQTISSEAEAEIFIRGRLEALEGLLKPDIDPYIGKNTVPSKCRPENLPKNIFVNEQGNITAVVSLYSSANLVLGLCDVPDKLVKTQYVLLYCGEGVVHTARYFYSDTAPWLTTPIVNCKEK